MVPSSEFRVRNWTQPRVGSRVQASDFRGKSSELGVKRLRFKAIPSKPCGVSVQSFNFGAAKNQFDQIGEPN